MQWKGKIPAGKVDDRPVIQLDIPATALAVAGVIVEAEPMTDDLVSRACRIAERAGADYVVTSWGEVPARRTVQRAALLRDSVGPRVQVKASGRFRTLADVRSAAAAGTAARRSSRRRVRRSTSRTSCGWSQTAA